MKTSTPFILPFDVISAADLPHVGGKGANLGEMANAGFPIPPGFCVTTAAFQQFIAACPDADQLYADMDKLTIDDIEAVRQVGQRVRERLTAVPIPENIAQAILTTWEQQGAGHAYAIRSSATAEDLPDASFAGQQDTFLNVRGQESLLDSVRRCWVSLFTDRAILYRIQNGFAHRDVFLSVVVQRMVMPDVSGILFTADPITGRRHIASIDASFGLGEALVAGLVSADLYQVDKQTNKVIEAKIAEKKMAIRPLPDGGVIHEELTGDRRTAPSLTDQQAVALAKIGTRIETHYGQPQDVEWAIENDTIHIVQSRPITSLYPLPAAALKMAQQTGELQVMFSFGAVQGMLEPMTRLGQDAIKGAFAGAATLFGYDDMTIASQQVMWAGGERLFVNMTALIRHPIGRKMFRGALTMIEPSVVQALNTLWDDPRLAPTSGWFKLSTMRRLLMFFGPAIGRLLLTMRRPHKYRLKLQHLLQEMAADFERRGQTNSTLAGYVSLFEEMMQTGFAIILPNFIPVIAGGMSSLNLLLRLTHDLPDDSHNALVLTRGMPYNVTTEMDLALWDAAQAIKADETAAAYFEQTDADMLAANYLTEKLPGAAQTAVSHFLDQYGMRGVGEIDIGRPRWRENPAHIMQMLQSYLQIEDPARAPDAVFARGAAEAEAAIEPLAAALRQTGGGWIKARLARFAAHRMRALAGLRESPKFLIMRLFGIIRAGLLKNGQELVAAGLLTRPDDLFFLHLAELKSLAAGEDRDWAGLVAERRALYDREKQRTQIPRLLMSDGHTFYEGLGAATGEGDLSGNPVSPGVVEGRVHVVFNPHGTQLAPGEILVCPGTDPAWTPLFLAAGGLVMEVGGLMTHGSVVAREYGIPAVVGVHEATTRLQTGQRIRVDGSAGTITILENGDAPEA